MSVDCGSYCTGSQIYAFATRLLAGITLLCCMSQAAAACLLAQGLSQTVAGIADSRTLRLSDATEFRLSSILTPSPLDQPAGHVSRSLVSETETVVQRVVGQSFNFVTEGKTRDRYGRRVGTALALNVSGQEQAYRQGLPARLIKAGAGRVMLSPEIPAACAKILLTLEAAAEREKQGLWKDASYAEKRAEDVRQLLRFRGSFQIVVGVVARVSESRSGVYLNFGNNWKTDFTVRIGRSQLTGQKVREQLQKLRKHAIRVRGWIERRNGPYMRIWRLEHIELLQVTKNGNVVRSEPPQLFSSE